MAPYRNKPCQFYGLQKICLQTKFELSKWTLALSGPVFVFRSLNKVLQQIVLSQKQKWQSVGLAKRSILPQFRFPTPKIKATSSSKTTNGGEPNALHVSYQRPSKREPPRFARRLKNKKRGIFLFGIYWNHFGHFGH